MVSLTCRLRAPRAAGARRAGARRMRCRADEIADATGAPRNYMAKVLQRGREGRPRRRAREAPPADSPSPCRRATSRSAA